MQPHAAPFRLVIAGTFILMLSGCFRPSSHPDDELIKNFQTHQAEFKELLQMFLADEGLVRVDFDFTRPENSESVGVPQARLDQYRRLFVDLSLSDGVGADWQLGKEKVWFFASAPGPRKSSQKHYLFMNTVPVETIDNLDDPHSKQKPYRHIQGNWYLFLEDLD